VLIRNNSSEVLLYYTPRRSKERGGKKYEKYEKYKNSKIQKKIKKKKRRKEKKRNRDEG